MKKNFANLIKVKTIISFAVIGLLIYMAVTGQVSGTEVKDIALIVIAFYFGTQAERNNTNSGGLTA